jgi:hypothetical protein
LLLDFDLPLLWPLQEDHGIVSGGTFLGNVALDVRSIDAFDSASTGLTKSVSEDSFSGLVVEAQGPAERALHWLEKAKMLHGEAIPFPPNNASLPAWHSLRLPGLLGPTDAVTLRCYQRRSTVVSSRARINHGLRSAHGGSLGVIGVSAVVVGCKDLAARRSDWQTLLGRRPDPSNALMRFPVGPDLRLVQDDEPGIQQLVVWVQSLERARQELQSRGLWTVAEEDEADEIAVRSEALQGLVLVLREPGPN